jgi:hypothetical protein
MPHIMIDPGDLLRLIPHWTMLSVDIRVYLKQHLDRTRSKSIKFHLFRFSQLAFYVFFDIKAAFSVFACYGSPRLPSSGVWGALALPIPFFIMLCFFRAL